MATIGRFSDARQELFESFPRQSAVCLAGDDLGCDAKGLLRGSNSGAFAERQRRSSAGDRVGPARILDVVDGEFAGETDDEGVVSDDLDIVEIIRRREVGEDLRVSRVRVVEALEALSKDRMASLGMVERPIGWGYPPACTRRLHCPRLTAPTAVIRRGG